MAHSRDSLPASKDRAATFKLTQSTQALSVGDEQEKDAPSGTAVAKGPPKIDIDTVSVRIIITGGDPLRRFTYVTDLQSTLGDTRDERVLVHNVAHTSAVVDPLRDVYGLSISKDLEKVLFSFTDGDRVRNSVTLRRSIDTVGITAEWKLQVAAGTLPARAPCDCKELGKACQGAPHGPEIHIVLKINHLMEQTKDYFETDSINSETISDLEEKLRDLQTQKEAHEGTTGEDLQKEIANLKDEVADLKSQITGLQLVNEDLEEQMSGTAKKRTLRSKGKKK